MGQALYRKYRSRKLSEIVGQKPVTTALNNALKSGQISHAYLFTGPRGVGKTSIARILAYEINNLPYDSDQLPIDIIEIDAASNRRIEEIRDLREKVRIAPVSAKFKIYIIDEVHMLTRDAFNALLKTLEEPPAHVIFILATTEAHKLPETIVSRTQRYTFKLASQEEVSAHLKKIAGLESIEITDEALALLAKHSGGSLRDALSLLDQVRHSAKKIDANIVRQNLGLPSNDVVAGLLAAIQTNEPKEVISSLEQSRADGASATLIAEQLLQTLRDSMSGGSPVLPTDETLHLSQALLLVETSSRADIQLELALIGAQLSRHGHVRPAASPARMQVEQPPLTISEPAKRPNKIATEPKKELSIPDKPSQLSKNSMVDAKEMTQDIWIGVLDSIRQTHNTIYSILRMAKPDFDKLANKQITLSFQFPFHQKRLNEAKNKQIILDTLAGLGVVGYELICELTPKSPKELVTETTLEPFVQETPPEQDNVVLSQIRSVFGGAEVLE